MEIVEHLLDISGIGYHRMQLRWVSSAEGPLFADYITQFSEQTQKLGPFDPEQFKLPLAAVEKTLSSPRIRWLIGMTKELTEAENVYHEKLKDETYKRQLKQITEEEYYKAMIVEVLRKGPHSVHEMAEKIGLPVYSVSLYLNELERHGQAELTGYDGTTPKFIGLAA
jgi:hypothetical protein